MKSMEIRVTALEFGRIVTDAHSDINPYDIVRALEYIKSDTSNVGISDYEYKQKLVNSINAWLKEENYQLRGTKAIGVMGDYYVLDIPKDYGKQVDMFGGKSLHNLLQNAGLR